MTKDIISGVFDAPLDASRDKEYKGTIHCLKTIKRMETSALTSHDKAGILKEKSEERSRNEDKEQMKRTRTGCITWKIAGI